MFLLINLNLVLECVKIGFYMYIEIYLFELTSFSKGRLIASWKIIGNAISSSKKR